MAGDQRHIHDPAKAKEFAHALGLQVGGAGHPFVGNWGTKGLYAYRSGQYNGIAYFGTGGSERDRLTMPHESDKYRPWNRYDPDIPDHIRKKLIELEDDDSTSIGQYPQSATTPFPGGMLQGEKILVSEHRLPKYNGIYTIQNNEINGKPWFKNNSGCILYFYNANSGGGPSWSLDDRSQDGTNDWFRGGWIEPPNSGGPPLGTRSWAILETHRRFEIKMEFVSIPDESGEPILNSDSGMLQGEISLKSVHGKYLNATPEGRAQWDDDVAHVGEYFRVEQRQNGKIALMSAFDMYVSAQPDGSVEINRREAPPGGWEEFTVEYRSNDVVCLKSCHGKYLSAQQDGTAQWNRDHAPIGGWEEIQIEQYRETSEPILSEPIEILEAVTGKPVRFKLNDPPNHNDAWVGIYLPNASDQDHGAENNRWKWLRNIDVNNVSFPKRAAGRWSIRVFSNGGHTLHERKDFDVKPPEPVDQAVLESSRRSALIALFVGMVLLAPSIPLFIAGLGEGLSEGMTSATLEIKDSDGQGDLGWGIYIEGSLVDYNSNGIYDHCENIIVNATHSGSWMSDPWTGYQKVNPPDESRQVFEDYCGHTDPVELRHHEGRDLIKIGQACHGCMAGTTTITAQNSDGGEVVMWIQNEEKKEVLGMLIPGAIFMGIGGFTFIVSLFTLLNMGFKSMAPSSSKRRAVAATGVGITLVIMGLPLLIIGSISAGEGRLAMLIPGVVMFSIGVFVTVVVATIGMRSTEGHSSVAGTGAEGSASTTLEVLSFNHNQPIRFRINNPPHGNDAWVGIYPASADDRDHGGRWQWLRDIEISDATFPGQSKGKWSIRLFSDGGYTLHERTDFEILEGYKNEVWMRNARIEASRIIGDMIDHPTFGNMNRRTSTIIKRTKHGNMHRFETNNTTYLIKDEDLADEVNINEPFWGND